MLPREPQQESESSAAAEDGAHAVSQMWEFPKMRGILYGVLKIRILPNLGYYIRVPFFRNLRMPQFPM